MTVKDPVGLPVDDIQTRLLLVLGARYSFALQQVLCFESERSASLVVQEAPFRWLVLD